MPFSSRFDGCDSCTDTRTDALAERLLAYTVLDCEVNARSAAFSFYGNATRTGENAEIGIYIRVTLETGR